MKAVTRYKLGAHSEVPFMEVDGGSRLTEGSFEMIYEGDLVGRGLLREVSHYRKDGVVEISGLEGVTGTLGGRSGSFVIDYAGRFEGGVFSTTRKISPGSGSGELVGLRGEATWTPLSRDEFQIDFDYDFEG